MILIITGLLTACGMLDGKLSGVVIDAKTEKAVVGAELYPSVVGNGRDGASGQPVSATTDAQGHFILEALCLNPERSIRVVHEAYQPQEIVNPFAQQCNSDSIRNGVIIRLEPKSGK